MFITKSESLDNATSEKKYQTSTYDPPANNQKIHYIKMSTSSNKKYSEKEPESGKHQSEPERQPESEQPESEQSERQESGLNVVGGARRRLFSRIKIEIFINFQKTSCNLWKDVI